MKRREFITLLGGGAAAWPLTVRAQQGEKVRRIGNLMNLAANDPHAHARNAAFEQALQQLGWIIGSARGSHPTTSLWECRVVHHSKIDCRMAEMGHSRLARPKAEARPLRPNSGQTGRRFRSGLMHRSKTREQAIWHFQTECLSGLQIDD
jgi:hypothetical protein